MQRRHVHAGSLAVTRRRRTRRPTPPPGATDPGQAAEWTPDAARSPPGRPPTGATWPAPLALPSDTLARPPADRRGVHPARGPARDGRRPRRRRAAFPRALYLDPDHYDALIHLMVLADNRGDATGRRHYRRRPARPPGGGPMTADSVVLPLVAYCWNRIGVRGDRSCPELAKHTHCRNCPVFAAAGRRFLDAPSPAGYLDEWTDRLAAPGRAGGRADRAGRAVPARRRVAGAARPVRGRGGAGRGRSTACRTADRAAGRAGRTSAASCTWPCRPRRSCSASTARGGPRPGQAAAAGVRRDARPVGVRGGRGGRRPPLPRRPTCGRRRRPSGRAGGVHPRRVPLGRPGGRASSTPTGCSRPCGRSFR